MKAIRKIILTATCISIFSYSIHSQDIDSLKKVFNNSNLGIQECLEFSIESSRQISEHEERVFFTDKARNCAQRSDDELLLAEILDELAIIELDWRNAEKAERFSREALTIRKNQDDPIDYAKGLFRLGDILRQSGEHEEAIQYFKKSVVIFREDSIKNSDKLAMVYNSMGDNYTKVADYEEALSYLKQSLALRKEKSYGLASTHLNLAVLYLKLENLPIALENAQKSLNIFDLFPDEGESSARTCNTIAGIFYEQNNYLKAIEYYETALKYEYDNPSLRAEIKSNLGAIQVQQKRYDEALNTYLKEQEFWLEADNKERVAITNLNIGIIYYRQEQYKSAKPYYQSALTLARETGDIETRIEVTRRMIDNFYFMGQSDSALFYIDSLSYAEQERKGKYIAATNLELEQITKERQVAEFRKNKMQIMALLTAILALIVISVITFLAYRERSKRRFAEKDREQKVNEALKDVEIRLSNAKLDTIEKERDRISKHIHDSVGVMLASTKLHFEALGKKLDGLEENKRKRFDDAYELLSAAQKETRKIIHDMANLTLRQDGLIAQIKELTNTIQSSGLINVALNVKGLEERLDEKIETKVYRIIQELMGNALKFSKASQIDIDMERIENQLAMSFKDNGIGFDPDKVDKGLGLNTVEERVSNLGGRMNISSQKGEGTRIVIEQISLN